MMIPIILGTAREGRESEKVARFILGEAKAAGYDPVLVDVRDFRIPATDNSKSSAQAKSLASILKKADALIIVSPEYNHGYPGELKMALDLLYQEYSGLPLGIVGVSSGPFGGARAVEQLRLVAIELQMVPIRDSLHFPNVRDCFDAKGGVKDPKVKERAKRFFESLANHVKKK
jgi:NAD(P)H-dependent FMN reductase